MADKKESKKEKELFRSQRKAVEAGAHGTLEYTIKKGVNKKQILRGAKLVKKNNIMLYMFFMIGLPTETEDDVEETKKFLKKRNELKKLNGPDASLSIHYSASSLANSLECCKTVA